MAAAAAAACAAASMTEPSSDENNSNHSNPNEPSADYPSDENSKTKVRKIEQTREHFRNLSSKTTPSVFCCDACGVKFSTSDNLNAHQTYYCIKRADSAMSKAAALQNDGNASPKSIELPFDGPEEWKCNYCDVAYSSYDTIRRHLMTHTELKGFRCIVCGYKGNTWRGMRSHVIEHISDGSTSIEEFMASNVISENGLSMVPVPTDEEDVESPKDRKVVPRKRRIFSARVREKCFGTKQEKENIEDSERGNTVTSPVSIENVRQSSPTSGSFQKMDSRERTPDKGSPRGVNPLSVCDVVIKTENDACSSGEDVLKDVVPVTNVKCEHETESDEKPNLGVESIPSSSHSTSVIKCVSDFDNSVSKSESPIKKKTKSGSRQCTELKYCKACDISFYHLSNFLAHKKYYCVSKVITNCIQEATTVQ